MLTVARRDLLRVATRVVPDSSYSVVCVAVDRGYLDDPPSCLGLAHLFEHVWFTSQRAAPTLEWGETRENTVLLTHACPPDEVTDVVAAVARRLDHWARPATGLPERIATTLALIELERRERRELSRSGSPRRAIARALRGDPGFDPVAVRADGLDPDALADAVARFPVGRAHAVCVVGPTGSPPADDLMGTLARAVPESNRAPTAPVARLSGCWFDEADDAGSCATAWVLPRTPWVAAAAWLVGGLVDRRPRSDGLRWVSGRVVSPRGATPIRGGHLYAVAAGTGPAGVGGQRHPHLLEDHLLPMLRGDLEALSSVRASVRATRADIAELAAIDADSLLADQACGHDDVLDAVGQTDEGTLRRFADLLATSPRAEIGPRHACRSAATVR